MRFANLNSVLLANVLVITVVAFSRLRLAQAQNSDHPYLHDALRSVNSSFSTIFTALEKTA